jgi:hypothetical protein
MATAPGEGKAVLEVRVFKPNGEKGHHASEKDYPDINP